MRRCEDVRAALHLYVDSELPAPEELEIEAHLLDCVACRRDYDDLRAVVDTVRGSKPLYEPSEKLRHRVEQLVRATRRDKSDWRIRFGVPAAAAAALTLLLPSLLPQRTTFTAYAANAHLRYASGRLPLDVSSSEPHQVSAWLRAHLPFHLSVPQYPADSGEAKAYTLVGARLMQYGGDDVAYLSYDMAGRPVSLLVSASQAIEPAGDEVLRSGNLLFHFSVQKGLKLITWRDKDLVYALVSDVRVSNAQSCVVCHGSAEERSRFENMSPQTR